MSGRRTYANSVCVLKIANQLDVDSSGVAIYHFAVKTVSRSDGRSAVAAAAYRAGERLHDERTGYVADFSRKRGIIYKAILAPKGAGSWALRRPVVWNAAEAIEKRCNSTVAREYEFALPIELDDRGRIEIAVRIAQHIVDKYRVVTDVAVHAPPHDGSLNWHVHILTSTRKAEEHGFGEKTRELDSAVTGGAAIAQLREVAARITNEVLANSGLSERVDHRSFQAQAAALLHDADKHEQTGEMEEAERARLAAELLSAREAGPHVGPRAMAAERRAKRQASVEQSEYQPVTRLGALHAEARAAREEVASIGEVLMAEITERHRAERVRAERIAHREEIAVAIDIDAFIAAMEAQTSAQIAMEARRKLENEVARKAEELERETAEKKARQRAEDEAERKAFWVRQSKMADEFERSELAAKAAAHESQLQERSAPELRAPIPRSPTATDFRPTIRASATKEPEVSFRPPETAKRAWQSEPANAQAFKSRTAPEIQEPSKGLIPRANQPTDIGPVSRGRVELPPQKPRVTTVREVTADPARGAAESPQVHCGLKVPAGVRPEAATTTLSRIAKTPAGVRRTVDAAQAKSGTEPKATQPKTFAPLDATLLPLTERNAAATWLFALFGSDPLLRRAAEALMGFLVQGAEALAARLGRLEAWARENPAKAKSFAEEFKLTPVQTNNQVRRVAELNIGIKKGKGK